MMGLFFAVLVMVIGLIVIIKGDDSQLIELSNGIQKLFIAIFPRFGGDATTATTGSQSTDL